MGAIEYACLALASLIMAGNQAIKDAPKLRALVPRGFGWVNYLPLVLVLLAGGLWVVRKWSPPPTPPAQVAASAPPINGADYAPPSVSDKFTALYSGTPPTDLQVDLLLRPYIGKRIRFSATMATVSMGGNGILTVQLSIGEIAWFFVDFPAKWQAQLSVISPGTKVNVDAMIADGKPAHLTDGALF